MKDLSSFVLSFWIFEKEIEVQSENRISLLVLKKGKKNLMEIKISD